MPGFGAHLEKFHETVFLFLFPKHALTGAIDLRIPWEEAGQLELGGRLSTDMPSK